MFHSFHISVRIQMAIRMISPVTSLQWHQYSLCYRSNVATSDTGNSNDSRFQDGTFVREKLNTDKEGFTNYQWGPNINAEGSINAFCLNELRCAALRFVKVA